MKLLYRLLFLVASAAFFIASSALAQNTGTVTNHAFAVGKGPGTTGYTSLLCGSAQLAVGQAAADPICQTVTGDVTINASGVTAIGSGKVTEAMLAAGAVPSVTIESQGGGCGVSDNTTALLNAVSSVSGTVRVLFPKNCSYTFTQANALTFNKAVYIEGNGMDATTLVYSPSSNGTFLQWSNGVNVIFKGGINNISIYSSNTANVKIAVQWYDVSGFYVENVSCNGTNGWKDSSNNSICFYPHGRDTSVIRNIIASANQPMRIGMNPHSYQSADVYHFEDLYLIGDLTNTGNAVIAVDPGVVFTSTTFDGMQSWNGGGAGFSYVDTAAVNFVSSVASGGSGYSAGQILTVSGGTCSTAIQIQVLSISGSAVSTASIANPGVCTVVPSNPVSVTTGSATFNLTLVAGYRLKFANVRSEQGYSTSAYSFNIQPKSQLQGITIENSLFDPGRCGAFFKNTFFATISHSTGLGNGGCTTVVSFTSANSNDMLIYDHNFWLTGAIQDITGMSGVYNMAIPTGTSATVPPEALYSSTASGFTFGNLAASSFTLGASNIGTAWTSYSPTLVSLAGGAIGSGNTLTGSYKQIGKTTFIRVNITIGASGIGTATQVGFTLPAAAAAQETLTGKQLTLGVIALGDTLAAASSNVLMQVGSTGAAPGNSSSWVYTGVYEAQ
jgi:hypothetical protein